jgi:lysozyme
MTNEINTPPKKNRTAVAALVVSAATLIGIAANEGYVGSTYKDAVGVPTIGFGETKNVKMGQTTTPVRALITLEQSIDDHVKGMSACIKVPISQGEFDAYTSFTYNVGVHAFCTSALAAKLNSGDYAGACKELLKWDHAGGKVLPGLTRRRQEEYKKCLEG